MQGQDDNQIPVMDGSYNQLQTAFLILGNQGRFHLSSVSWITLARLLPLGPH
jgi:hypothetical protein